MLLDIPLDWVLEGLLRFEVGPSSSSLGWTNNSLLLTNIQRIKVLNVHFTRAEIGVRLGPVWLVIVESAVKVLSASQLESCPTYLISVVKVCKGRK